MSRSQLRERPATPADRPRAGRATHRLSAAARGHALFLVLFAAGAALRLVAQLAYRPTLVFIDSFGYLEDIAELIPSTVRPLGYVVLLLRPLSVFHDLAVYPLANHLLGLGMALATYAVLLHLGSRRWLAALAAAPVLLDGYQLHIEQHVMADTLFQALVFAALVVLVRRRPPGLAAAAVAGLLLGLSVTVRLVGQPLVLVAVVFLLLAGGPWRRRLTAAVLAAACFAAPVVAYGLEFRKTHGEFALSAIDGRVNYARVAGFVDCATVVLPEYQRPLCPSPALQDELIADEFTWSPRSPARTFEPPPGMLRDDVLGDFAKRVIAQQPLDYVTAVVTDFAKFFRWSKTSAPDDVPVERWQFQLGHPVIGSPDPTRNLPAAVAAYGGADPAVSEPLTRFLRAYQLDVGFTPGTVLLAALLLGLAGALGLGRARRSPLRPACLLWTGAGAGLLLASTLFEFSWRYQLPGLVLLPVAGALGLTALRWRPPDATEPVDAAALDDFRGRHGAVRLGPVALVIAAYDEADSIGAVLDELPEQVRGLAADAVVVVDGATDATADLALAHGAYTCVAPVNRGQGAALRLGYRIAREGGADYIVTLDADGQYDPAEIGVVLEPLLRDEADFVTGSRTLGRQETDDPVRHAGVRFFSWLVSTLTGQRITDTSNGLRAMRAEVTGAVTLAQPQYQAAELLIGVLAHGYRVVERPTTMRRRAAGSSKKGNNLVYGVRYSRVVLGTWWRERERSANSSRSNTTNLRMNSTP